MSGISSQVAFANGYINAGVGIHPSEPNYIWVEAGDNRGIFNDADPCPTNVRNTTQHLSAFLTIAGKSWKSYQEDTDVDLATNVTLPQSSWTVPLTSHSGVFASGVNAYNYSNRYNYAAKHNPMVLFSDTNGGCDASTANSQRLNYAPLQQLALDLANNTTANYTGSRRTSTTTSTRRSANGYGQYPNRGSTADSAWIAQGDNFLARVVPLAMASDAYQDHGLIVLWWDESEGGDDSRTLPFIVISKDAHRNVNGVPYSNTSPQRAKLRPSRWYRKPGQRGGVRSSSPHCMALCLG
jgi:hypothetical protein